MGVYLWLRLDDSRDAAAKALKSDVGSAAIF